MRKISKKALLLVISVSIMLIIGISFGVYALISKTSTRGNVEITSDTITATTEYTSSTNDYAWTYTEAGDYKTITIATTNASNTVLHNSYNIASTGDSNLLSAVLVYLNDTYIGTLSELNSLTFDIEEDYSFIPLATAGSDVFKFELHQSAKSSIFDAKNISVTITTYSQNADYLDYMYVTSEADFKAAVDDINSGLFDTIPTIILCNTVTLASSYTLKNPATIHLNGKTLNGTLILNDTDALLTVLGTGTFNTTVTLTSYDTAGALALVTDYIKEKLGEGVAAGSTTNIIGNYGFYGISVSASSNCTYTTPNVITANTVAEYYTKVASIVVGTTNIIEFKVLGTKAALLDATLAHLPESTDIVMSDLFLPTYIKDENAVITWKSSDESILSSNGKIPAARIDNETVKLYAEIKVNETVLTRTFSFKVSAHNNEINFYKLVQEISPVVIEKVYSSPADADDALYYLPIVDESSTYDYRKSYDSPVNNPLLNWTAYKDIGLVDLTYSMTQEQKDAYTYITQPDGTNNVYLNTETLNNFARINITGDFGNNETYTTFINISISVGSNTQLLEKAFIQVSEELAEISVLGNIIRTRTDNGMANEKGDFTLSSIYAENPDYTIEFSGADTIIDSITYDDTNNKYIFAINPEYFNEYETTVAFTATVYYKKGTDSATSKSRTFYVTVPAALHVDDFGTISIYNSIKYQTFNQLPEGERANTSGYTISGTELTDKNINYILLRDIVGDTSYIANYNANNIYLDMIDAIHTNGVKSLYLKTNNNMNSTATDSAAYDFIKLVQWATDDKKVTARSVVSNATVSILGNTLSNIKSNGENYLNNAEISVLKACYQSYTGASDSDWNAIYNEVLSVSPGYIYTNSDLLNTVISTLNSHLSSGSYSTYFGKYMEILQRYALSTTKVNNNDVAPCQEQYNSTYVWYHSDTAITRFSLLNNNGKTYTFNSGLDQIQINDGTYWYRAGWPTSWLNDAGGGGKDGVKTGFFATTAYAADRTSYITRNELQVVMMFWLNVCNISDAFTTAQLNSIQTALSDNPDYYQGYSTSDFSSVGQGILNAFYACLEIPTYFSTDGVAKLIKYFYNNYNNNGNKYELSTYDDNTKSFKSILDNNVPYLTNLDNLKTVLSYFSNLKTLEINGSVALSAFLSENGLSTAFARISLNNSQITRLIMKYCAHSYLNFDLTNIKNLDQLIYIDLSNNKGIKSTNELVNINRGNYVHLDIANIGIEHKYQEFAIDNIATSNCTVYYTDDSNQYFYSNDSSRASDLADLSDFNKFISKNMFMTNIIYNDDGTTTTVNWRINEGNEIYNNQVSDAGPYITIDTLYEMNLTISPYYYCNESIVM